MINDETLKELRDELGAEVSCVNIENVSESLVIIWNYEQRTNGDEISMAFSGAGNPRCWASKEVPLEKIVQIGGVGGRGEKGPDLGTAMQVGYPQFEEGGVRFYPYSIQRIPVEDLHIAARLKEHCDALHTHLGGDQP